MVRDEQARRLQTAQVLSARDAQGAAKQAHGGEENEALEESAETPRHPSTARR